MDIPEKKYCLFVKSLPKGNIHRKYHDEEYGLPIQSDEGLFERLVLEMNQAGLSWEIILKKKDHFFKAYQGFKIDKVAAFDNTKIESLLLDSGIIRNRLKIQAAIYNAQSILQLQKEFGSFKKWLDMNHPLEKDEWVRLFKKHFKFTGGEIVHEFLMSCGYLPGAHASTCPIYKKILPLHPAWLS
ncbi:MAG: DNA-3-methyladenine glycosylase I [Bacteroidetes bacterium]|nr:DNA-3-methyladenine glycosylase I [Bacteroidota bacterium]